MLSAVILWSSDMGNNLNGKHYRYEFFEGTAHENPLAIIFYKLIIDDSKQNYAIDFLPVWNIRTIY